MSRHPCSWEVATRSPKDTKSEGVRAAVVLSGSGAGRIESFQTLISPFLCYHGECLVSEHRGSLVEKPFGSSVVLVATARLNNQKRRCQMRQLQLGVHSQPVGRQACVGLLFLIWERDRLTLAVIYSLREQPMEDEGYPQRSYSEEL